MGPAGDPTWLLQLLTTLFGQPQQGGGMGLAPGTMTPQGGLPKISMDQPIDRTGGMGRNPGQSPYADFERGLPKTGY